MSSDENALRVFKTAMLLMALMSSTKGIYSGRRSKDGIAATEDCLATCLAGVMTKKAIHDLLQTMQDSKLLILDKDNHDNVRLQLPFKGTNPDDFSAKLAANEKKYSRYMMFSKDGAFAQAFEKQAADENDATNKRMKIAVCCAETLSIKTRLAEIAKELEKSPYKLGLLLVAVQSDAQAVSIQTTLQQMAIDANEPQLIITKAKMQFGNDMSAWSIADLSALQRILKQAQQEKAKKEKLAGTKANVRSMKDSILRDRVTAFLDAHPEFCDNFAE